MSRSKIVATIGPGTADPQSLLDLVDAGMGVARLNGSHGDFPWHANAVAMIREHIPDVPIILDLPGRKTRTRQLAEEPSFGVGDVLILTTDPAAGPGKFPVDNVRLHEDVSKDLTIFADDGTLRFTVVRIDGPDIHCRAETAGTLKSRKGINVPGMRASDTTVTDVDRRMIVFAKEQGIDFVGISFVESKGHVDQIRELIDGGTPRVVSKVETADGVKNLNEICAASDAIMIDRGDLSIETSLETLVLAQKQIIDSARAFGKPVIVATEMLHSMIDNPFPTKAEVGDITNAVLDGCSATMLSGETAVGAHPLAAVSVMRKITDAAMGKFHGRHEAPLTPVSAPPIPHAIEDAIALICRNLEITKIIAITMSGHAAGVLAARHPSQPIIAISNDPIAARSFNLLAGTEGVYVDVPFSRSSTDHMVDCLEALWRDKKIVGDDLVLVTGVGYPKSGNLMNLVQVHLIQDLVETLDWK